ncbi:hypothetical protein [Dietzia sp.]|uniref:hypothetical protein n=1 Tax=Dietzia sp. TaxID=1871616 RepID=UPI002FD974F8
MGPIFDLLLFCHLLGLAAVLGGFFVAAYNRGASNPIMLWGARLQLIIGIAFYAYLTSDPDAGELDHMLFGFKILVGLAVVALFEVATAGQRRAGVDGSSPLTANGRTATRTAVPRALLVYLGGALVVVNVILGMAA